MKRLIYLCMRTCVIYNYAKQFDSGKRTLEDWLDLIRYSYYSARVDWYEGMASQANLKLEQKSKRLRILI